MKYLKFDNNNFKPLFVDWAITNKCYLSCAHCRYRGINKYTTEAQKQNSKVKSQKSKVELELDETLELTTEINAINPNWVLIEGGEPFLRNDLFNILEILKPRINTDDTVQYPIYIITSGMGFNKTLASKCKEMGIRLMISFDSANKETYELIRQGANYDKVVDAISIAQEYQILDSINVTLQELNCSIREIKAIGQFAYILNINKINFLGYKPNSACAGNSLVVSDLQPIFSEITNIGEKYKIKTMVDEPFFKPWLKEARVKTQVESTPHGSRDPIREARNKKKENKGPIVVEEKAGCIFGEYVFIEPDGTTKPCSFSPVTYNEIGNDMLQKIQNRKNRKGKCSKCKYQLECGGCRVRTFTQTGDWFESDPFCPL